MIIKIEDYKKFTSSLWEILEENNLKVSHIKKGKHWEVEDKKGNIFQLLKGKEIYNFFKIKSSPEQKSQVISPAYTIVKEENKSLILILKRTQGMSGSTDQKLPYSDYMVKEYKKILMSNLNDFTYDIDIAIITNEWFNSKKYSDLRKYLLDNGIKLWTDQIKIN